jgi:hypothetical protein
VNRPNEAHKLLSPALVPPLSFAGSSVISDQSVASPLQSPRMDMSIASTPPKSGQQEYSPQSLVLESQQDWALGQAHDHLYHTSTEDSRSVASAARSKPSFLLHAGAVPQYDPRGVLEEWSERLCNENILLMQVLTQVRPNTRIANSRLTPATR